MVSITVETPRMVHHTFSPQGVITSLSITVVVLSEVGGFRTQ